MTTDPQTYPLEKVSIYQLIVSVHCKSSTADVVLIHRLSWGGSWSAGLGHSFIWAFAWSWRLYLWESHFHISQPKASVSPNINLSREIPVPRQPTVLEISSPRKTELEATAPLWPLLVFYFAQCGWLMKSSPHARGGGFRSTPWS